MKCIIGIGNPGKEYEKTRHNVGFRIIDLLKKTKDLENVELIKPSTYVNLTGEEVLKRMRKHKLTLKDVLVVCDDVHLPVGKMRLRAKGSSGGHKGLQSIIEMTGAEDFSRLRIGVGSQNMPKDLAKFVLGAFPKAEEEALKPVLQQAVLVCEAWALEGVEAALKKLNKEREK